MQQDLPDGRVLSVGELSHRDFLQLCMHASVLLDPFPFAGGTTSLEAMSMGTPVVTLPDEVSILRITQAFYKVMGVSGLIADDEESFVSLITTVSSDVSVRSLLSHRICTRLPELAMQEAIVQDWATFLERAATRTPR